MNPTKDARIVDLGELAEFLVRAKKKEYATGEPILIDGFKVLEYPIMGSDDREKFHYTDAYTGSLAAPGMETVRLHQREGPIIWTMLYYGGMLPGFDHMAHETFDFLKRALSHVQAERPFRGTSLMESYWSYTFTNEGNIRYFKGHEKVYHHDRIEPVLVFEQDIIGGLVHGKQRLEIVRK